MVVSECIPIRIESISGIRKLGFFENICKKRIFDVQLLDDCKKHVFDVEHLDNNSNFSSSRSTLEWYMCV